MEKNLCVKFTLALVLSGIVGASGCISTSRPLHVSTNEDTGASSGAVGHAAADMPLSWDGDSARAAWSRELLADIERHKSELDAGQPDSFIPGYAALSPQAQTKFWAEFLIAIAKFESGWDPHQIYHEPPPLGVDSVGLLQLSYEDQSPYQLESLDRNAKSLENPLINLRCGVQIMAHLIAQDRVIASGGHSHSHGAARYWSVLWEDRDIAAIKNLVRRNMELP